jgi:hypothetical protein
VSKAEDQYDGSETGNDGHIEAGEETHPKQRRFPPAFQQNGTCDQRPENVRIGIQSVHHCGFEHALLCACFDRWNGWIEMLP